MKNIGHEASKHFRNKKWEYLKDKINAFAMNSSSTSGGRSVGIVCLRTKSHGVGNEQQEHEHQRTV
jgi:hypothetical protein